MTHRACVIGSGPNGLAAAIVLAQAGLHVDVFEAEAIPGGAVRSMELTLPGFLHDFGSAVYPLGAGSPFFASLPLHKFGLEWIHSPAPVAHPLDNGTAVILERSLKDAKNSLGDDGPSWEKLLHPFVEHWKEFAPEVLAPVPAIPRHPLLMARFATNAFSSAKTIAYRFRNDRTRALFAGLAAHSFLKLTEPLSGAFGLLMAIPAHAVGWPIPLGGAQSLTNALCQYFASLGGLLHTSRRIASLSEVPDYDLYLCDVTPRQLLKIAANQLSEAYKRKMQTFRYGPGVFKMDYALRDPVPWKAPECRRAATVHLGGSFDEIAASEAAVRAGQHADQPFVLFVQPSLFDPSRAPADQHTAWAYCHVPNGSKEDMRTRIENQIERFAPGFRDCVLARNALSTNALEAMDANLVGGDIGGGIVDIRQLAFRPTWRHYATSAKNVFVCSSSTPPGGGVHGMCGYHAAKKALSTLAG
ncbi:MAG TPA: NAD(P)/FAD-dependent oxidoreductase [Terriglobales bacterium]|nr:NAD(P)/FAD-dependent oxidoreductase [Terriglobales bacterium]